MCGEDEDAKEDEFEYLVVVVIDLVEEVGAIVVRVVVRVRVRVVVRVVVDNDMTYNEIKMNNRKYVSIT